MKRLRYTKSELDAVIAVEREAIDAVCRKLMIQAARDQATVRAVVVAIDKIRVAIRDRANQ